MNAEAYFWWEDHDKKKGARQKLDDALTAYAIKYGQPAVQCLTSVGDAIDIGPEPDGLCVGSRPYIRRNIYYLEVPA